MFSCNYEKDRSSKKAYTLAEIVIVLLIIAAVVAVSIRITKAKLDSIVSITYYSAYSSLKSVTEQMMEDNEFIRKDNMLSFFDYLKGSAAFAADPEEENDGVDCTATPEAEGCNTLPDKPTIPLSGENFCNVFANYTNIKSDYCNGTAVINEDEFDFLTATPDMILRNGMRIYNLHQDPIELPELANNTEGAKYIQAGVEKDANKWAYVVYIDINGSKGDGVLWDDVYKFFVTVSGKVIPAFNAQGDGGDNRFHLQVSVQDINEAGPSSWILKSKSFKEAACTANYIGANTPYCNGGVDINSKGYLNCASNTSDCRLKIVIPVRL